jgi:glycosyltransferase involved in cell wall biosynthesis
VRLFLRKVHFKKSPVLERATIRVSEVGEDFSPSYLWARHRARADDYRHLIAIDPHGFVLCQGLFRGARAFYYSLELYLRGDHRGLVYPEAVVKKERSAIHSIRGLIIQSEEKERIFRDEHGLESTIPSFLLPVAYTGAAVHEKSPYLRERFGIDPGKRIALCLGGMVDWNGSIEIALEFARIPGWVLFFHGQRVRKYVERMLAILREKQITNVIVSDEFYEGLEDTERILASSDVGLAWYKDISIGFRTVGRSSGKIAAYMRFGLPTIATRYPSTVAAIEETGAGVCVDRIAEIPRAVSRIEEDPERYAAAARREYERTYRFERYEEGLASFLESSP